MFRLIAHRPDNVCNFVDVAQLSVTDAGNTTEALLGGTHTNTSKNLRIIYRHYATLFFVFIVDEAESELGILDLIQVCVIWPPLPQATAPLNDLPTFGCRSLWKPSTAASKMSAN